VQAYIDWIGEAALVRGPVFRGIDRWGHLSEEGLHANSVIPLLRQALERAGIAAEHYTSHSLRRGFATWAHQSGWDLKSLMSYVGWKDMKSAMRYVEASPFWAWPPSEKPLDVNGFLLLIQSADSQNQSAASGLPMSHPSVSG
jgi:integrase